MRPAMVNHKSLEVPYDCGWFNYLLSKSLSFATEPECLCTYRNANRQAKFGLSCTMSDLSEGSVYQALDTSAHLKVLCAHGSHLIPALG